MLSFLATDTRREIILSLAVLMVRGEQEAGKLFGRNKELPKMSVKHFYMGFAAGEEEHVREPAKRIPRQRKMGP